MLLLFCMFIKLVTLINTGDWRIVEHKYHKWTLTKQYRQANISTNLTFQDRINISVCECLGPNTQKYPLFKIGYRSISLCNSLSNAGNLYNWVITICAPSHPLYPFPLHHQHHWMALCIHHCGCKYHLNQKKNSHTFEPCVVWRVFVVLCSFLSTHEREQIMARLDLHSLYCQRCRVYGEIKQ